MSRLRRFGSTPLALRDGVPYALGLTRAWTSTRSGRLPSRVGATTLPGCRAAVVGEERAGRVGHFEEARLGHLEDADLVGRAEPVLGGAEQAQRRVPLALEVDHGVDEVLECLGPGDRTVLRHVTDEDHGDPVTLGEVHQAERRFADLADAPGRPVELVDRGGLDRIDDDHDRALGPRSIHDPADVVLGEDPDAIGRRSVEQAQTCRPQAGPGRATPRPRRTAPTHRPERASARPPPGAGAWTCRCRVRRRPGRASPAPVRHRALGRTRRCRAGGAAGRRRRWPRDPRAWRRGPPPERATTRAARVGSWTTVSTRLFHSPQAGHWPSQRRNDSAQDWQTKRLFGRAIARPPVGRRGSPRLDRGAWLGEVDVETRLGILVHDDRGSGLVASPSSSCSARTSSIMFWMTRRSGRAP